MTATIDDTADDRPAHPPEDTGWERYLATFHAEHPGITEAVLGRAVRAGTDPYDWLAAQITPGLRVLDLACGSGPLRPRLRPSGYLGVDSSLPELEAARHRGVTGIAAASATRLPLPDAGVDAVACSMALMLVPLHATLREVRRVLAPGGTLVATLPATGPLTVADRLRYARLLFALRRPGLRYPGDALLSRPRDLLASYGLRLTGDRSRRFAYPIREPADGRQLVHSLYLPDATDERLDVALRVAGGWAGADIGIPIRLVTATAGPPS